MPRYDRKHGYARQTTDTHRLNRSRHGRAKSRRGVKGLLVALSLTVCMGAAATLMYFSDLTLPITNTFALGSAKVEIVEPGVDPGAVDWGTDTKPVQLKNSENGVPGVVRAKLIPPTVYNSEGDQVPVNTGALQAPSGNTVVMGDFTLHLAADWQSNWFYKDGWFYCNKVLAPGQTSAQLLAGLTLTDPGKADSFKDYTIKLDVLADILQTEGEAPLTEWGVTVSESGAVSG